MLSVSTLTSCLGVVYIFLYAIKYKYVLSCVTFRLVFVYNFVLNCADYLFVTSVYKFVASLFHINIVLP